MNHPKMMMCLILTLITGAMALCIFLLAGDIKLAAKPVAIILFVSFLGHITCFMSELKK